MSPGRSLHACEGPPTHHQSNRRSNNSQFLRCFNMGLTPHRTLFWKMLKKLHHFYLTFTMVFQSSGWSKFVQGVSVDWARQRCSSQLNKVKIFSQFLSSRFATSYSKYLSRTYVAKLHDQSLDKCWIIQLECTLLSLTYIWKHLQVVWYWSLLFCDQIFYKIFEWATNQKGGTGHWANMVFRFCL